MKNRPDARFLPLVVSGDVYRCHSRLRNLIFSSHFQKRRRAYAERFGQLVDNQDSRIPGATLDAGNIRPM